MKQCKFVISPPGNALDCHRTWEALYMGCIPLLEHSSLDRLFDDLPVILVTDWHEVNEVFLAQKYAELQRKTFNVQKLYIDYWFTLIRNMQAAARAVCNSTQ